MTTAPLSLLLLLGLPAVAATPMLPITIDSRVLSSRLEVGFLTGGPRDNAVIKILEGSQTQGPVDILRQLSQKGDVTSARLGPGKYQLAFGGFLSSCAPRLYVRLPDLPGAGHTATFTAQGSIVSSRIVIKDVVCDANAKKYFKFEPGAIKVVEPVR